MVKQVFWISIGKCTPLLVRIELTLNQRVSDSGKDLTSPVNVEITELNPNKGIWGSASALVHVSGTKVLAQ